MATAQATAKDLLDHRLERYVEMRFTHKEAALLANSLGDDGRPLDYQKVKKALTNGCGHKMAVRIFENAPYVGPEEDDEDGLLEEPKKISSNISPVSALGRNLKRNS